MKTIQLCRQCGKPLPPDALLGLCPECLMKAGLPAPPKVTIAVAPDAFVEGPETETKEFVTGTKLGYIGDYELLEEIARGGMGVVYKARQSSLKRIVAVKMIRSGELAGETEVKRFHTEAEAAAQLQHPGIVAIHEIGEHEGRHYFSMDFVEGRNIAQVAGGHPVAARSAAEWLKAIAEAVQFAHQRGVLHRDLKPQNIMLDAASRPRVTDFGLAKNLGRDSTLTNTGAVMGSPSYMSPEQARGRNDLIGPASDVYSLGAILYELLTGRPPFRGKTPMDTMSQVVNDEPPRPRSLNPAAPVDLETICLKCLEKEPVRRYPTARELEADLGRFLDGEPVQARPANALRRTTSWLRRHPWMLSAVLSVLILTLAGLAYGLWEQNRFLSSLNAHPGLEKAQGARTAGAVAFQSVMWVWIVGLLLLYPIQAGFHKIQAVFRRKFKTRRPWNMIFWPLINPLWDVLPASARIMGPAARGVFCIVFGLYMAANAIDAFVWERALPSGLSVCWVFLFIYAGVNYLLSAAQMRIPIESSLENKTASPSQARVFWWGIILSLGVAWMLSAAQAFTFSKAGLSPLVGGLVVGVSSALAMFVLSRLSGSRLSGDLFGSDSGSKRDATGAPAVASGGDSAVAGWKRVCRGMWRWIKGLVRIAIAGLAIVLLAVNASVAIVVIFGDPSLNPNPSHGADIFICGLAIGLLLILYPVVKMRKPREPRLEDKPTPLSPEQLAPIHEAIFAGRTNDALKLYVAATGGRPETRIADVLNFQKMTAELKQAHPEKFSAGALNGPKCDLERNAQIAKWLVWGGIFLGALFMLAHSAGSSLGSLFGPLFGLMAGLGLGVLIRLLSSNKMAGWKWVYRSLFHVLKFAAWLIIALFAFLFTFLIIAFASRIFTLITQPGALNDSDLKTSLLPLCAPAAGWLMAHLWLRQRKGP